MYYMKANQDISILILDIKTTGADSKYKRVVGRGPDINRKVNVCFYRLKDSSYNILAFRKVTMDPFRNH